jgi:hypothetical protein
MATGAGGWGPTWFSDPLRLDLGAFGRREAHFLSLMEVCSGNFYEEGPWYLVELK